MIIKAITGVLTTWGLLFLVMESLSSIDPETEFREQPSLACKVVVSGALASTTFALWLVMLE